MENNVYELQGLRNRLSVIIEKRKTEIISFLSTKFLLGTLTDVEARCGIAGIAELSRLIDDLDSEIDAKSEKKP